MLLVLSASTAIDPGSWGELCLRTLQAQGLPTVVAAVPTLHPDGATGVVEAKRQVPRSSRQRGPKSLLSFAKYFSPDLDKCTRSTTSRAWCSCAHARHRHAQACSWRDFRAWMVSESAEWEAVEVNGNGSADANGLSGLNGHDAQREAH